MRLPLHSGAVAGGYPATQWRAAGLSLARAIVVGAQLEQIDLLDWGGVLDANRDAALVLEPQRELQRLAHDRHPPLLPWRQRAEQLS